MNNYVKDFCTFLTEKGYKEECLEEIPVQSRQLDFAGVAVKDKSGKDGKVVQAFALMSNKARTLHHVYPFYRTHKWGKNNGDTFPSCSIACQDEKGEWKIYDARESARERTPEYLDFDGAVARFNKRIGAEPARELNKMVKTVCWSLATLFAIYLILRIVFPSIALPLDSDIILLFILISALILLPLLLPLVKSLSFYGIDVIIGKE